MTETQSASSSSSSLIHGLRERDEEAWNRLCDYYGDLVFHWCSKRGLNAADAADVSQETFAGVSSSIANYQPDPTSSFRAWLFTICRHKINDHYRGREKQAIGSGGTAAHERLNQLPDNIEDEESDPKSQAIRVSIHHKALNAVRAEFEDNTWTAFYRTTVDCEATKTVADELRMSPAAVRKAKSRVLRRLRQELGDVDG